MSDPTLAVFFGLAFGFLFGVGLALAIGQLVYRRGYRKAVADSLEPVKPKGFKLELEAIRKKRATAAAKRAAEIGVEYLPESQEEPETENKQLRLRAPKE
jgi:hypothetical protein